MKNICLCFFLLHVLTGCSTLARGGKPAEPAFRKSNSFLVTLSPGQVYQIGSKELKCIVVEKNTCQLEYADKRFWLTQTSNISPSSEFSTELVSVEDGKATIKVTKKKRSSLFWRLLGPPF